MQNCEIRVRLKTLFALGLNWHCVFLPCNKISWPLKTPTTQQYIFLPIPENLHFGQHKGRICLLNFTTKQMGLTSFILWDQFDMFDRPRWDLLISACADLVSHHVLINHTVFKSWSCVFKVGMHRSDTQHRLWSCRFLQIIIGETRPIQIRCCAYTILCCCLAPRKPQKHHKAPNVFVHYIWSVLKLFHSLIRGTDEYLSR